LEKQLSKLDNQVRFILCVINKEIIVNNRKKAALLKELEQKGFDKFENDSKAKKSRLPGESKQDDGEEGQDEATGKATIGYNYLLAMPIWNLTMERVEFDLPQLLEQTALTTSSPCKVEKLKNQRDSKREELENLQGTPIKNLWARDLDAFLGALEVISIINVFVYEAEMFSAGL